MKTFDMLKAFGFAMALVVGAGCYGGAGPEGGEGGASVEPEPVGTAEEAITGGTAATAPYLRRAVYVVSRDLVGIWHNCTGTVIGKNHVLTAGHCYAAPWGTNPIVGGEYGTTVYAYDYYSNPGSSTYGKYVQTRLARATAAYTPNGVTPSNQYDTNGIYADYSVITLDRDIAYAYGATVSTMYHKPLTSNFSGLAVGAGRIDGALNDAGKLMQATAVANEFWSDKSFDLDGCYTDHGDSGGPFYYGTTGTRVAGVASAWFWDYDSGYTSVPQHLGRILDVMNWPNPFTVHFNLAPVGTVIETFFTTDSTVCAYACDKNTSCVAYAHWFNSSCQLLSSVSSWGSATGVVSGS